MIVIESGYFPPDRPRIGAFPVGGAVVASSAVLGFAAEFAASVNTAQFWRPVALPATWELVFTDLSQIDYFGIAAHDLGTAGASIEFQVFNGATWLTVISHAPQDDSPIFGLFEARQAGRARIRITGPVAPHIGIVMFGRSVEFPQPVPYVGRRDFRDQIVEDFTTNQSDGGNFLGRYVARRNQRVTLNVSHLSETWKVALLDGLIEHLTFAPCFVGDCPASFPRSVVFGYLAEKPVPERTIPNSAASVAVSMDFIGHVV